MLCVMEKKMTGMIGIALFDCSIKIFYCFALLNSEKT